MEKKISNRPMREEIKNMEVNDVVTYPAAKLCSVKTTCSMLGFVLERKYKTRQNREDRTISVTRIK